MTHMYPHSFLMKLYNYYSKINWLRRKKNRYVVNTIKKSITISLDNPSFIDEYIGIHLLNKLTQVTESEFSILGYINESDTFIVHLTTSILFNNSKMYYEGLRSTNGFFKINLRDFLGITDKNINISKIYCKINRRHGSDGDSFLNRNLQNFYRDLTLGKDGLYEITGVLKQITRSVMIIPVTYTIDNKEQVFYIILFNKLRNNYKLDDLITIEKILGTPRLKCIVSDEIRKQRDK